MQTNIIPVNKPVIKHDFKTIILINNDTTMSSILSSMYDILSSSINTLKVNNSETSRFKIYLSCIFIVNRQKDLTNPKSKVTRFSCSLSKNDRINIIDKLKEHTANLNNFVIELSKSEEASNATESVKKLLKSFKQKTQHCEDYLFNKKYIEFIDKDLVIEYDTLVDDIISKLETDTITIMSDIKSFTLNNKTPLETLVKDSKNILINTTKEDLLKLKNIYNEIPSNKIQEVLTSKRKSSTQLNSSKESISSNENSDMDELENEFRNINNKNNNE